MSRGHLRNTVAMLASARCGARTRSGGPCRSPAVKNKLRCRMHGGARGSGGRAGNTNAFKHGGYTDATRQFLKEGEEDDERKSNQRQSSTC